MPAISGRQSHISVKIGDIGTEFVRSCLKIFNSVCNVPSLAGETHDRENFAAALKSFLYK